MNNAPTAQAPVRQHDMRRKVDAPDPRAVDGDTLYRKSAAQLDALCDRIKLS